MKRKMNSIVLSGLLLAAFGVVGASLLVVTQYQTRDKIAANYRMALMHQLMEVLGDNQHDNDFLEDKVTLAGEGFHSSQAVRVYRVRSQGKPVAAIFVTTTPKGYAGSIQVIVALRMDRSISGVRVVRHHETPGLGDKMELAKSDWILGFTGTSLQQPKQSKWAVKKDGGDFDQFTGATITPRAIVNAVRDVLLWAQVDKQFESVFVLPSDVSGTKHE